MKAAALIILFTLSQAAYANDSLLFQAESFLREGKPDEALEFVDQNKLSSKSALLIRAKAHHLKKNHIQSDVLFTKLLMLEKKPKAELLMNSAQVKLKIKKPKEALMLLKKVRGLSLKKELLLSQALWDLGKREQAFSHLKNLPNNRLESRDLIERQKIYYLFEMGKVKKVFDVSRDYLGSPNASAEFGLYGVSLFKKKDRYLAELYFDLVLSFMPKSALILKERGVFELESDNAYLASLFLDKAAHADNTHSFEAAAVHLDLGHHHRALFFNSKVEDLKKKTLQQFTIYLDSENFEKALSLQHELKKRGLLEEDKVSYALMYSAFKVGDYGKFANLLTNITTKTYLSKVLKLKEIVDSCKKSVGLQCVFS